MSFYHNCEDPYNRKRNRNKWNTDCYKYNCGGLALGTYSWYLPYDLDGDDDEEQLIVKDWHEAGYSEKEICQMLTDQYVEYMLNDFGGRLQILHDVHEAAPTDTIIMFRVGVSIMEVEGWDEDDDELDMYYDTDFHFRVRRNGHWIEKMGDRPISISSEDYDLWEGCALNYNGPIVLMVLS